MDQGGRQQLTPLDRTTQRGRRDLYPPGFPASFCPAGSGTAIGCFSKISVLFPSAPSPAVSLALRSMVCEPSPIGHFLPGIQL